MTGAPAGSEPREIRPGLWHWTASHPKIHIQVSSYYVEAARVLLDPLLPPLGSVAEGVAWLREHGPPEHVLLTNRHHYRHCAEIERAFATPVWCNERGLHEFREGERVRGFRPGEVLPGDVRSYEVGALCPDETALWFALGGEGCLAVADGVVRDGDGPLSFVPDFLIAEDPEELSRVKKGLRDAYRRLLGLDFDTLLLAHGLPIAGGGKQALRAFVGAAGG